MGGSTWEPPTCIHGGQLFFVGFSEVGRYVTWMRKSLDCVPDCRPSCLRAPLHSGPSKLDPSCPYGNLTIDTVTSRCFQAGASRMFQREAKGYLNLSAASLKGTSIRSAQAFTELRDGLCREYKYGNIGGINASCAAGGVGVSFNMTFRWKTFQKDRFDADDLARVQFAARHGRPVFVVLEGGGPHHFARFREHHRVRFGHRGSKTLFTATDDRWSWPQAWIDDYVAGTKALMRLYASARLPPNVCVLWKALHIAPRANKTSESYLHHPSVANGPHQWLNRLAISSAQDLGIGVVDMSDLTLTTRPVPKLTGLHPSDPTEGDPYHGFPLQQMAPELLKRMCAACTRALGATRTAASSSTLPPKPSVPHQCAQSQSQPSKSSSHLSGQ
jgi:hypothetical protein